MRAQVTHPETGETSEVTLPDDHDGSRVKVEFPDGVTTYTEGFDPAERSLSDTSVEPGVELHTDHDEAATSEA